MRTFEPLAPKAARLARHGIGRHGPGTQRHTGKIDDGFDEHLHVRADPDIAGVDAAGRGAQPRAQRQPELVVDLPIRGVEPPGSGIVHRNIALRLRKKEVLSFR
jgi:hypothetical protein